MDVWASGCQPSLCVQCTSVPEAHLAWACSAVQARSGLTYNNCLGGDYRRVQIHSYLPTLILNALTGSSSDFFSFRVFV